MSDDGKRPGWWRRRLDRVLNWRISLAGMLAALASCVVWFAVFFGAFCTWVQIRNIALNATWEIILDQMVEDKFWLGACAFFAAVVLYDPGPRLRRRAHDTNALEERSNYAVQGLLSIRAADPRFKKDTNFREARENLLHAAAVELRHVLKLPPSAQLKANLVLAKRPDSITVAARSEIGSPIDIDYKCEEYMVSWQAMRDNATKSLAKVSAVPGHPKRPYEAVAAVPISHGAKAFGALTFDSVEPGVFTGREALIDRVARPYAAAILLTIGPQADHFPCPNRYDR
jgi:hypothetical protein